MPESTMAFKRYERAVEAKLKLNSAHLRLHKLTFLGDGRYGASGGTEVIVPHCPQN